MRAWRAASAAPAASRSKLPRISCATQPSGTSPAKVIERASSVDGEDGAHDVLVGLRRIADQQREQQAGAGQALGILLAEIALVEIERRLAVELVQHVAAASG